MIGRLEIGVQAHLKRLRAAEHIFNQNDYTQSLAGKVFLRQKGGAFDSASGKKWLAMRPRQVMIYRMHGTLQSRILMLTNREA